jgi:hypothetical protein
MEKGKKALVILLIIAFGVIGFFVYKIIKNKQAVPVSVHNAPATSSIDTVKEREFNEAIKNITALDQDVDGISDSDELKYKTDATNSDTDGDGLSDWQEITIYKTDPLKNDSDNDTFTDGYEVRRGFNPIGAGTI